MDKRGVEMLEQLVWIEKRAWPEEVRASERKLAARLGIFPEGIATVEREGKMVAFSTSLIFDYNPAKPPKSWEETTDDGWIINVHSPTGNALYLVSVGVAVGYQGMGCGSELLDKQKAFAKKLGLSYVVLGCRVPSAHLSELPIEEVVKTDPQVNFYKKNGFAPVIVRKNYMQDDPESRNYGVVMAIRL